MLFLFSELTAASEETCLLQTGTQKAFKRSEKSAAMTVAADVSSLNQTVDQQASPITRQTLFLTGGTCDQVNTYDECVNFAAAIGAPSLRRRRKSPSIGTSRRRKSPTGCYQYLKTSAKNDRKVYYASGQGKCTSRRTCICKPNGLTFHSSGYSLTACRRSGSSLIHMTSLASCNAIAKALGAPGLKAFVSTNRRAPSGCFQYYSKNRKNTKNNLKVYYGMNPDKRLGTFKQDENGYSVRCTPRRKCLCHA